MTKINPSNLQHKLVHLCQNFVYFLDIFVIMKTEEKPVRKLDRLKKLTIANIRSSILHLKFYFAGEKKRLIF